MPPTQLTPCELEVMNVVWDRGRATVQEVVDALDRSLAYTTVMTTLRILDEKGAVRRCGKQSRAYVYEPAVSRESLQRTMAGQLRRSLFGGSVTSMVLSLLDPRSISPDEIDELRRAIESLEDSK